MKKTTNLEQYKLSKAQMNLVNGGYKHGPCADTETLHECFVLFTGNREESWGVACGGWVTDTQDAIRNELYRQGLTANDIQRIFCL